MMARTALVVSLIALAVALWSAQEASLLRARPDQTAVEWRAWAARANRVLIDLDRRLQVVEREALRSGAHGDGGP
jgi:hypothetical protein